MDIWLFILIFWLAPLAVATAIGRGKNRAGWAWGLFLGWLGVIIVVLLKPGKQLTLEKLERQRSRGVMNPEYYEKKKAELLATKTHRECPHCKEQMRRDASVCPHCQRDSQAWTQNEGYWWKPDDEGRWLYLDELSGEWRTPAQPTT